MGKCEIRIILPGVLFFNNQICYKIKDESGVIAEPFGQHRTQFVFIDDLLDDDAGTDIQAAAPVDSFVTPEPWVMPGYDSDVIMAAGAFIGGSSIELSADAPIRPPYNVYFQGGLTYEHSKFGVIKALQALYDQNLVEL